jgi:hypothetical protein
MSSLIKTGSAPAHVRKRRASNALSESEKKFINEHKGKIPQAEIAKKLRRGYSTINKFCSGKVYDKKEGFFDVDSFVF